MIFGDSWTISEVRLSVTQQPVRGRVECTVRICRSLSASSWATPPHRVRPDARAKRLHDGHDGSKSTMRPALLSS